MFYRPGVDAHGLPHDPFKACVAPRPIAWVSTRSEHGVNNLAPFSFFNAFSWAPPVVALGMPAKGSRYEKDTIVNIETTGCFAINMPRFEDAEAVNLTSTRLEADVDEFTFAGIASADCHEIDAPRVLSAPITFECRYLQTVLLPSARRDAGNAIVLGQVVGIHIADSALRDGRVDYAQTRPLVRLGYRDWAAVGQMIELQPPAA